MGEGPSLRKRPGRRAQGGQGKHGAQGGRHGGRWTGTAPLRVSVESVMCTRGRDVFGQEVGVRGCPGTACAGPSCRVPG